MVADNECGFAFELQFFPGLLDTRSRFLVSAHAAKRVYIARQRPAGNRADEVGVMGQRHDRQA